MEIINYRFEDFDSYQKQGKFIRSIEYQKPGSKYIRFNFDSINYDIEDDLEFIVEFSDANGSLVERIDSEKFLASDKFVPKRFTFGDTTKISLVSTKVIHGLNFNVRSISYQSSQAAISSITEPNNLQSILRYENSNLIWQTAKSIARIIYTEDGYPKTCSGFLISNNQFITNEHCVSTQEVCETASILFGYNKDVDIPEQFACEELQALSYELDTALLLLEGFPGEKWGVLNLVDPDFHLEANIPYFMIQHPGGRPKHISKIDCKVRQPLAEGRLPDSDFTHTCDSVTGSSGSPIIDESDGKVIGVHHLGFSSDDERFINLNRGIRGDLVSGFLTNYINSE